MSKIDQVIQEIRQVADALLDEVLDFVRFLKARRAKGRLDTAIASESALAKDWLQPEEDVAWQDL